MYFRPEAIPGNLSWDLREGMTSWSMRIPSARGNKSAFGRDSRHPSNEKGPGACAGAFEVEGMTGIEPA